MLAVGAALVGATWAHALLGFGGATADELFARWIYDAVIFAAAFTLLWRGVARPEGRLPWLVLGVGVALHLVGDVGTPRSPTSMPCRCRRSTTRSGSPSIRAHTSP